MASSVAKNVSKKTTLRSSDGEVFEAVGAVAAESQTTKHLSKAAFSDKPSDADEEGFHFDFVELDPAKLFDRVLAANNLNIRSGNTKPPLDLACQIVADMKGKTPEEIRKTFDTKMEYLASLNTKSPLDEHPWDLTSQAIADMFKETTKIKKNYLAANNLTCETVVDMIKEGVTATSASRLGAHYQIFVFSHLVLHARLHGSTFA